MNNITIALQICDEWICIDLYKKTGNRDPYKSGYCLEKRKNSLFIVLSLVAALLFPRSVFIGLKDWTYPPSVIA